jgi:predicted phosphodiesterase
MKIRLLSDIHQEFYEDKELYKSQGEDVLVLAGDINVGHERTWSALKQFYENQTNIVYVPGNHEYYRHSINTFDDYISRFTRDTNIKFLNPGSVTIAGVTFIGATLWTDFRSDTIAKAICSRNIRDFSVISGFSTNKCVQLNTEHIKYIRDAYSKFNGKKVIVTHFLPAIECIAPEFQGPDLLNYYFANDYGDWIADLKDTTWLFGHTHSLVDKFLGDTRVVANPYGYNYNSNYKECIIEV